MKLYDGFLSAIGLLALLILATAGISKILEHADPIPPQEIVLEE